MSQGTVMIMTQNRLQEKDFTVATPEEFVHRFNGTKVINKVHTFFFLNKKFSYIIIIITNLNYYKFY